VKTKEKEEWFGRLNVRHLREYVNFTNEQSVPVFLWFALVDTDDSTVHREAFVEVHDMDQLSEEVVDVGETEIVFRGEDVLELNDDGLCTIEESDLVGVHNDQTITEYIPSVHGNEVVELNDDEFRSFPYFLHRVGADEDVGPRHRSSTEYEEPTGTITTLSEIAERGQQLLWERIQPNVNDEMTIQLRNSEGRMGPGVEEDSDIALTVDTDGNVAAEVDDEYVELGNVLDE
jgi:hypothetical protein